MKNSSLIPLIALAVVAAAGGYVVGRLGKTDASSPAEEAATNTATSAARGDRRGGDDAQRQERGQRSGNDRKADARKRVEAIARLADPLERGRALLALVDQLGPDEFQQAIDHFRSLGLTEDRMAEYAVLLAAWAKVDPIGALDYAKTNTTRPFAINTILGSWASIDPDAAIRWAETNHSGEGANPYLAGIIGSIAASDPDRATALLTGMPRSVERGRALDAFLPQLVAQGMEATRAWIDSLGDEALRDGAIARAAEQLAATDPAAALDWLVSNPGSATNRSIDDVYRNWMRVDRDAAVASLATLPQGETRANALRGVVSDITREDPQAAIELMDQYTGDVNDRVVQNFIWNAFGTDPASAVSQIGRITDEGSRNRMYGRTLGAWLERDPAGAGAWIDSNPLPERVLERLENR